MAELRPIPMGDLVYRMLEEPRRQGSLFDLPLRKVWKPRPDRDLSVAVHGHRAQSPVGPAAGPHAQLAQNIVLSWLGGSRIIELKTVQILDTLEIPRPCIDAATVGYNVEWSQELPLEASLREYVTGWMLVRALRHLDPMALGPEACAAAAPVFELSVGYDLKGLQQPRMRAYLERVKDVSPIIEALRPLLPERLRDLDYDPHMVSCVTLSTFHGCPPQEIEAIAHYLIDEIGVDVIVKLNPTLLGHDEVHYLLSERMGYHDIRPKRAAFDGDLKWEDAIALGRRLLVAAAARGRSFGVKMTNTLVVENHRTFFDASQKEMYLSGPPLHVLAMHCVERWRAAFADEVPLSFSGGIDQHNFADAAACDLVPVTTCTDLLRPGGYGRLPKYLENLEEAMGEVGAADRDALILRRFGKGAEAVRLVCGALREETALGESVEHEALAALRDGRALPESIRARVVRMAGVLNAHEVTARVTGDPRYAAGKNGKPPRKVGSTLVLLDCLSCDKCVPVCPNDANFAIETTPGETPYEDLLLDEAGRVTRAPGGTFKVGREKQWANWADACNECGNCDVFCPEDGGPYVVKARFFGSQHSFDASPKLDGLLIDWDRGTLRIRARIGGLPVELVSGGEDGHVLIDGKLRARYDVATGKLVDAEPLPGAHGPHRLSGAVFLTLRTLATGALDVRRINSVNARTRVTFPGG